jgi:thymidylate synthase (FAD)
MVKPVLDKGFVRLVGYNVDLIDAKEENFGFVLFNGHTLDAQIVRAARVSYGHGTKTVRDDAKLIKYLLKHEHWSPFEMVEFKFHVKAPIFVARQWFRHRTANVNEISGRYSVLPEEVYIPEAFRKQDEKNKQGSNGTLDEYTNAHAIDAYTEAVAYAFEAYKALLKAGVAREMARMVLPLSTYTEFYWKQDLRNLLHFLRLRMDQHAQWEIQEYARAILSIIEPFLPITINAWKELQDE